MKSQKNILILIAALTLLRLFTAPFFGYGVDEAHYVLYARHLALSYFDHPPLVGWVHYVFSFLGTGEFWARVPAILLGAVDSYLVYLLLRDRDEKAALWAVAAFNASFVLGVLLLTLMPDTLLITLMLLLLFAIKRLERRKSLASYLLLGAVFGLLGLSKYTAILFVVGFALYIIWTRRLDMALNVRIIPAILVSLLFISPVILWNLDNNFASFAYQASHVGGGDGGSLKNFFTSLARQFAAYNPALFIMAFYGLYAAFKKSEYKLEISLAFPVLLFMLISQYRQVALPHWISPFFALFVPIGAVYLYLAKERLAKWVIGVSLALAVIVHAELIFKLGRFEDYKSPFRDIAGWSEACVEASKKLEEVKSADKALAVTNWTVASRAIVYSNAPVYLIDERKDQFDIWERGSPVGKDLLFINPKSFHKDINASFICGEYEKIGSYEAKIGGGVVDTFEFELCRDFRGAR